jgi:nitric oxide dioxygenase
MKQDQIDAIQESFAKVVPIFEQAATLFYGRLFETAPALKPLFQGDMAEQGRKLMVTLGVVVNGLADLESVLPAASSLARRHVYLWGHGRRLRAGGRGPAVDVWSKVWGNDGRRNSQ